MGKTYEMLINKFNRGITSDPREKDTRYAQLVKSFDAHTFENKLVPFRSSESGDDSASTSQKQNFTIALRTGTTYSLYALGVVSGTGRAEILYKDLTTGASTDLDDNSWATPSNNQSSVGATAFDLFVYYAKAGFIYGAKAGTSIWRFSPSGAAFVEETQAITYTNIAQGLVHSKDDILYIPYDNKIAKLDNTSWTVTALTLPTHFRITSICEYGNYLAIAAAPLSGFGKSVVYLWDRDATLATLAESIDWGEGSLRVLEEIDGYLVGVSYVGFTTVALIPKVVFRYYAGSQAIVFRELINEQAFTSGDLPLYKQKINKNLYFQLKIKLNGTIHHGIWKVGKTNPNEPFSVTLDRVPNNDTAVASTATLTGFYIVGDYVFQSWNDSGYNLSKTDDATNYTVSATYESVIFGESYRKFKLVSVGVMTDPMPTAGQVILKYQKDEDIGGTWTTIFTHTTDNSLFREAINTSSGAELPQFREIQFQILSTGGAEITGLWAQFEEIDDGLVKRLLKAIANWFG